MTHDLSDPVRERADDPGQSGDRGLCPPEEGQTVLVFQGGGALGAYQAGVFQALTEGGVTPDWVIGTSIGAINAALIAGNAPENRLARLQEFWRRVRHNPLAQFAASWPMFGRGVSDAVIAAGGVTGFFEPNPFALLGSTAHLGAEHASLYNVGPLERTLTELIDFDLVNDGPMRLTVGAADLRTGEMRYFDSAKDRLTVKHVMASGALPPAFPAVRIDGALYWDGGILSNTPVEAVFDDHPRKSGLVFAVHMWNPDGPEPDTLGKVMLREKDLRYSSRAVNHIMRQKQIHKLRHIVAELAKRLPDEVRADPELKAMAAYGCLTRMHVVRLLAPALSNETATKDIDFSAEGIAERWAAGREHTRAVLERAPWKDAFDPMEGFILHEANAGVMMD